MKRFIWKIWILCLLVFFLPVLVRAESELQSWPGDQDITEYNTVPAGFFNASGLDYHNGKLYAVDNGTGRLWILEAFPDGTLAFESGFEEGVRILFPDRESVPDTEGITVSSDGSVFVAVERDNGQAWIPWNVILQVEPAEGSDGWQTVQMWDLTDILPASAINKGIEAVEWVDENEMTGKLQDQVRGTLFDMSAYPQAVSGGIFFVSLEMNDHIYACVLNQDGTAQQVADLEPGLTGISALDYDTATGILWAAADDRGENRMVKLQFSEGEWITEQILPPEELDVSHNTEGFAIAGEEFTVNDQRPVYRLRDGVFSDALTVGFLDHHIHEFSEVWCADEESHWQECACGLRRMEECHILGKVMTPQTRKVEASRTHTAEYYQSCLVCGAVDRFCTFFDGQMPDPERFTTPLAAWIYGTAQM